MLYEVIHLKDFFPQLGNDGCDPYIQCIRPYNMPEMNRQNQKRPCMIVCPGGGYGGCSEREAEPIALQFLSQGYNVFVLFYSCAPHRFPTQLREVAAVMELIYKNADEWNCDTSRIGIIGFSAGGHLAAHYSVAFDCKEVRQLFPESKSVNASVLCYPVISADETFAHIGSFENLLGHRPDADEQQRFSCEKLVTDHTPPAFIWHTAEDTCVPVRNSLEYAQALSAHKVPFELHIYPFGWHGLATADRETCDELPENISHVNCWIPELIKWLKLIF